MIKCELLPEEQRQFPAEAFNTSLEVAPGTDQNSDYTPGGYLGFVITPMGRYDLWQFDVPGYAGYFGIDSDGGSISGKILTGQGCGHAHPGEDLPNIVNSVQHPVYGSGLAVSTYKGAPGTYEEFASGSEVEVVTVVFSRAEADAYFAWRTS